MPRLNKRTVEAAPVGFTWDSELPGFGLRVLATGRRSYILRYRTASGTDRLVTLGTSRHPRVHEKGRLTALPYDQPASPHFVRPTFGR